MSAKKDAIVASFSNVPNDDDKTNLFSTKHVMTNKELVGQVWGYGCELIKEYIPNTPVVIRSVSMPGNGARLVIGIVDGGDITDGYALSVYAISKRLGIVAKLCDMFEAGCKALSDEDLRLIKEGK